MVLKLEFLVVKFHNNHFGVKIPASIDIDHIKDFEDIDDHGGGDDAKGGADHRDHDAPEHGKAACPIDFSRLDDIVGDTFEGCRENHHAKACPDPDIDRDQREVIHGFIYEPGLRWYVEKPQEGVEQADLGLTGRFIDVDEAPDDTGGHQGKRHGDKERGLDHPLDLHPVYQDCDGQAQSYGQDRPQDQPDQIIPQHQEHERVGEDLLIVFEPNERRR